jgi:hypothetical protein
MREREKEIERGEGEETYIPSSSSCLVADPGMACPIGLV